MIDRLCKLSVKNAHVKGIKISQKIKVRIQSICLNKKKIILEKQGISNVVPVKKAHDSEL